MAAPTAQHLTADAGYPSHSGTGRVGDRVHQEPAGRPAVSDLCSLRNLSLRTLCSPRILQFPQSLQSMQSRSLRMSPSHYTAAEGLRVFSAKTSSDRRGRIQTGPRRGWRDFQQQVAQLSRYWPKVARRPCQATLPRLVSVTAMQLKGFPFRHDKRVSCNESHTAPGTEVHTFNR